MKPFWSSLIHSARLGACHGLTPCRLRRETRVLSSIRVDAVEFIENVRLN